MSELQGMMRLLQSEFPTCIQKINFPIWNGKPNPSHGKYFFVGRIPGGCYDHEQGKSLKYDTEQAAIDAAIAAGATRIQRCDCSFVALA